MSPKNDTADDLPPLAELFLHITLFVLPRDSFAGDRGAMLRLCRVRKNFVEQMHQCSGAFALDLHLSAKHIVMMSPYPCSQLAYIDMRHFRALKSTAERFRSIDSLSINLAQLPVRCNFVNTPQIVDLVLHCIRSGRAKHVHISHAIFESDSFTDGLRHLFPHSKNQMLSLSLCDCGLAINSKLLRELAGIHNLRHLALDGNKFHLTHSGFPVLPASLETLSVAQCSGLRPTLLKHLQKTLRTLTWSDNAIPDDDKPAFLAWITDSNLRALNIDNCGFHPLDAPAFQAAFARMPLLHSLSMAGNDHFEDAVFWWIYDLWKHREMRPHFFIVHVSNMHICYPDNSVPIILATSRFGLLEVHAY
jgi:hypothetical protein